MMPISSSPATAPQAVAPAPDVNAVHAENDAVTSIGDAPPPASVAVELSPVAQFLLTVSQSQQQLTQLESAVLNGSAPQNSGQTTLQGTVQNVVSAFNLLPSVDFNQAQPPGTTLQNLLVQALTQPAGDTVGQANTAQALAQIGISLQSPVLSSLTGGLTLNSDLLNASFNNDNQATTGTLQQTLTTFSQIANQFAEQLSNASARPLPTTTDSATALSPADVAVNARLDLARAELSTLPQTTSAADQLTVQRAAQDQLYNTPQTASTVPSGTAPDQAASTSTASADKTTAGGQSAPQAGPAAAAQSFRQQSTAGLNTAVAAQAQATAQAGAAQDAAAAAARAAGTAGATQNASASVDAARSAAAQATAQAQAAQQAASVLAAQNANALAAVAQARAAASSANSAAETEAAAAFVAQQESAAQTTAANLAAANAAAADAAQQARDAEAAAAEAELALTNQAAPGPNASATSTEPAAPQASAAPAPAPAETSALTAQQQQALALSQDPLRANPALAGAIAAYNLTDTAVGREASLPATAVPRIPAVGAATAARGVASRPR